MTKKTIFETACELFSGMWEIAIAFSGFAISFSALNEKRNVQGERKRDLTSDEVAPLLVTFTFIVMTQNGVCVREEMAYWWVSKSGWGSGKGGLVIDSQKPLHFFNGKDIENQSLSNLHRWVRPEGITLLWVVFYFQKKNKLFSLPGDHRSRRY